MSTETTRAVMAHHIAALDAGDLDAIMADYADDAVMISAAGGVQRGLAALRAVFADIPAGMFGAVEMVSDLVEGEIGYIAWKMPGVPLGTDTFVVRDGKIVAQTVAMYTGG